MTEFENRVKQFVIDSSFEFDMGIPAVRYEVLKCIHAQIREEVQKIEDRKNDPSNDYR